MKEALGSTGWKPSTLVFDFEEDAIVTRTCSEDDVTVLVREFECIVQEVAQRGSERRPVPFDVQRWIYGCHGERETARLGLEYSADFDVFHKGKHLNRFAVLDTGIEANVGELAIDEVTHA